MAMLTLFPSGPTAHGDRTLRCCAPARAAGARLACRADEGADALSCTDRGAHLRFQRCRERHLVAVSLHRAYADLARQVFHSPAMVAVIADEIRYFLPAGQDFVIRNMSILSRSHGGVQIASIVMLLISSTGVFMPLEVALNQVWGAGKNRSYVMNQLVSLGLAFAIGTLTLTSIALTAAQHSLLSFLFLGNTDNWFSISWRTGCCRSPPS